MAKNLVVCCDGTNNAIAGDETNVLRLVRCLRHDEQQVVHYDTGVGTTADPTFHWPIRRKLRRAVDSAAGVSVREGVLAGHRFLMRRYEPGDRIYLFGFSRGAYTVRALGGMLHRCGLLRPECEELLPYAWAVFSDEDRQNARHQFGGAARIRKVFGREAFVDLVGVFDTVSAFGWLWDQRSLPNTANNPTVRRARHAMAADERRHIFRVNRFGMKAPTDADGEDDGIVERWFPGGHADVGGGYPRHEADRSIEPLNWMLGEAQAAGLVIDEDEKKEVLSKLRPKGGDLAAFNQRHDESQSLGWRIQQWLPQQSFDGAAKRMRWTWHNVARRRSDAPADVPASGVEATRAMQADA